MPKPAAKATRPSKAQIKPATDSPAPSVARGGLRLENWPAAKLAERANPDNWRTHPPAQLKALRAMIGQVGYAGAVLLNETTGHLIDGHARVSSAPPDEVLPVLVGRWTLEQERQILVSLDPLAAMAQADAEKLAELTADMDLEGDLAGLAEQLDKLQAEDDAPGPGDQPGDGEAPGAGASKKQVSIPESYQVVIVCRDEDQQRELFDRLGQEGLTCRLLTL
jgi:hypothetical protein